VKQQIVDMALTCLWSSGYSTDFTHQPQYSHSGIKKKEAHSQQVNLSVLKQLNPEQVEVDKLDNTSSIL
jgi:creatinine amidohydrolase/Fe(II)-dependent formamide hydrolase-like protein